MRSSNPESIRLYELKVERTELIKKMKWEKDEEKKGKLETELELVEDEIDSIYTRRSGKAHINWLLSEYGEDVFPDRD